MTTEVQTLQIPQPVQDFVAEVQANPAVKAVGFRHSDQCLEVCTLLSTRDLDAERAVIHAEGIWQDKHTQMEFDTLRPPATRNRLEAQGYTVVFERCGVHP